MNLGLQNYSKLNFTVLSNIIDSPISQIFIISGPRNFKLGTNLGDGQFTLPKILLAKYGLLLTLFAQPLGCPKDNSPLLSRFKAGLCTLYDDIPLQLGQRSEHIDQKVSVGGLLGGIYEGFGDALELDPLTLKLVHQTGKVDKAPGQPIQLPDHNGVTAPYEAPEFYKALPVLDRAGDLIGVYVLLQYPLF